MISRILLCVATLIAAMFLASPGMSQEPGRWGKLTDDRGIGQGVCVGSEARAFSCLALRCGKGRDIEIAYLTNVSGAPKEDRVEFAVDGSTAATLVMRGVDDGRVAPLDGAQVEALLGALASGSGVRTSIDPRINFTLKGSTAAIAAARSDCATYAEAVAKPHALPDEEQRYSDEATGFGAETEPPIYEFYKNADMWGFDLDDWSKDPLYQNLTQSQCQALCNSTNNCRAFTYNERFSTCILKNGIGELSRYEGAVTGVMTSGAPVGLPPPTSGRGMSIIPAVAWGDTDTPALYYERLRTLSSGLGRSCDTETADLEKLSASFNARLVADHAVAGSPVEVAWEGNTLSSRIPVWLMVSSGAAVRFAGNGFYALGPGPVSPFGIAHEADKTRALVALYARGAGKSGAVGVVPLNIGEATIDVSLVAYLRGCQKEVVLKSDSFDLIVDPAAPQIVVTSNTEPKPFHSLAKLSQFDRGIAIAEDRFRITTLTEGSEIVERQGRNLVISPTGRFVAVTADTAIDIVDVVDGTVVATLGAGTLTWMMNDSFAYSDAEPWAQLALVSTYSPIVNIQHQNTGPSCCSAGDVTHIAVDLENNFIGMRGNLGYRYAALQNPNYSIEENPSSGYASDVSGSVAVMRAAVDSIGPVAPVTVAKVPNFPGGPSTRFYDGSLGDGPTIGSVDEQRRLLASVGAVVEVIDAASAPGLELASSGGTAVIGTRSSANALDVRDSLVNQLSRIGLAADAGTAASIEAIAAEPKSWAIQTYGLGGVGDLAAARDRFDKEREAAGYNFEWFDPKREMASEMYCDQADPGANVVPAEFDAIERIEADQGNVWIVRVACLGGATMGSQRGASMLYVFDLSQPYSGQPKDYLVAENSWFAATLITTFYEYNFSAKLFGRKLVLFSPGSGKVAVFDLDSRKFDANFDNLRNGDLLSQVYGVNGFKYFVALGRDGSLSLFDHTGALKLNGRIVDDEIVVWNEHFQFDATAEGASFVNLRFPGIGGQYSFELFTRQLRVAGLAAKVLAGEAVPPAPSIQLPPSLHGTLSAEGERIAVSVTGRSGSGLAQVLVYQDGVLAERRDVQGADVTESFTTPRFVGARWISVVAVDAKGLVSLPVALDLGDDPRGTALTRLLAVGVDYYEDARIGSLNFAKADVGRFMDAFTASVPNAGADPVILTDRRADPPTVISAIKALAEGLQPGDHGVLFLAGHGLRDADGTFYFGTSQTNLDNLSGTAVHWDDVASALAVAKGQVTVFIDACHSGASTANQFASNDDAVAALNASGSSNITVLAASKGRELSGESGDVGGGYFTQALAQVMTDKATYDANGNGRLEVDELYAGVKALVVASRRGLQTPWLTANSVAGQYAIF